jgi:hypothetical protein
MTPQKRQKPAREHLQGPLGLRQRQDVLCPSRITSIKQRYAGTLPGRDREQADLQLPQSDFRPWCFTHSTHTKKSGPGSSQWSSSSTTHGALDGARPERGMSRGQGVAAMLLVLDLHEARCEAEHSIDATTLP